MKLREIEACIKVVRIIEKYCDYTTLIEFQDILTDEGKTHDIVNWLGEIIDKKERN